MGLFEKLFGGKKRPPRGSRIRRTSTSGSTKKLAPQGRPVKRARGPGNTGQKRTPSEFENEDEIDLDDVLAGEEDLERLAGSGEPAPPTGSRPTASQPASVRQSDGGESGQERDVDDKVEGALPYEAMLESSVRLAPVEAMAPESLFYLDDQPAFESEQDGVEVSESPVSLSDQEIADSGQSVAVLDDLGDLDTCVSNAPDEALESSLDGAETDTLEAVSLEDGVLEPGELDEESELFEAGLLEDGVLEPEELDEEFDLFEAGSLDDGVLEPEELDEEMDLFEAGSLDDGVLEPEQVDEEEFARSDPIVEDELEPLSDADELDDAATIVEDELEPLSDADELDDAATIVEDELEPLSGADDELYDAATIVEDELEPLSGDADELDDAATIVEEDLESDVDESSEPQPEVAVDIDRSAEAHPMEAGDDGELAVLQVIEAERVSTAEIEEFSRETNQEEVLLDGVDDAFCDVVADEMEAESPAIDSGTPVEAMDADSAELEGLVPLEEDAAVESEEAEGSQQPPGAEESEDSATHVEASRVREDPPASTGDGAAIAIEPVGQEELDEELQKLSPHNRFNEMIRPFRLHTTVDALSLDPVESPFHG